MAAGERVLSLWCGGPCQTRDGRVSRCRAAVRSGGQRERPSIRLFFSVEVMDDEDWISGGRNSSVRVPAHCSVDACLQNSRGVMLQISVVSPRLCCSSASSASRSSFPVLTSASIYRSHASASQSTNQARNFASSSADNFSTSRSSTSSLVMICSIVSKASAIPRANVSRFSGDPRARPRSREHG
jgi:hypothetical protein